LRYQALERRASQTFDYLGAAAGGADDGVIDAAVCQPQSTDRYTITIVGGAATFALTATPIGEVDEGRFLTYNSNGQRGWDENDNGAIDAGENDWEES
jgi:type IV pilus assembly protein PilE